MMQLISLFSGIGGFELAAEWMGWDVVASCEINPFGQRVLKHYWPEAYHHDDIHTLTHDTLKKHSRWDPTRPTILTGGFPCQPYSTAGKRRGKEDDRHLWPEMLRVIREVRPDYIVGENVLGLVSWDGGLVFDEVHSDLEAEGYEVQAVVIPAAAVNAPHGRDRIWFCARLNAKNSNSDRCDNTRWEAESGERKQRLSCSGNIQRVCGETGIIANTTGKQNFRRGQSGFQPITPGAADEGAASDTNSLRLEQRTDRAEMGAGQSEICSKRNQSANAAETDGKVSDASDTNSNGRNSSDSKHEKQPSERWQYAQHDVEQVFKANRFPRTDWSDFPTEPPVCFRNDGIPTEMDGITFSKWRNESIKAAGNAIVPQVAYSIFKTIQLLHE